MRLHSPESNGSDCFLPFRSSTLNAIACAGESVSDLELPLMGSVITAGFPSPADDYVETHLDLNSFLVKHPSATYFVRVSGDSMSPYIHEGDYLIVDRALNPKHNDVVIAVVERELTVKRLFQQSGRVMLSADNTTYPPIRITGEMQLLIWGVVCGVFRKTV